MTRDEIMIWLNHPVTRGFYNILTLRRDQAEDVAFNITLENYTNSTLTKRSREEIFSYTYLEVMNKIILEAFNPLYEDLKKMEINGESSEEEEIDDSIKEFIKQIEEAGEYVSKRK